MRTEGVYCTGAAGYGYYTLNFKRSARDYTDDGQVTIADQLAREKGLDPTPTHTLQGVSMPRKNRCRPALDFDTNADYWQEIACRFGI